MTTTTTSAPAPASAKSATAGVNLSTTTIVTTLLQAILGAVIAAASVIFAIHSPTQAHILFAVAGGLIGALVSGSAVWHLLHLNSTTSANTLSLWAQISELVEPDQSAAPAAPADTAPAQA